MYAMNTTPEPIAYDIRAAVSASNGAVSRTALYQAIKDGELTLRKRGKRSFLLAADFRQWLESMPTADSKAAA